MPRRKRQKTPDTAMSESSSNHPWADLPAQLSSAIEKANKVAQSDGQLSAFVHTDANTAPDTFGIKGAGSDKAILTTVSDGKISIRYWDNNECGIYVVCSSGALGGVLQEIGRAHV